MRSGVPRWVVGSWVVAVGMAVACFGGTAQAQGQEACGNAALETELERISTLSTRNRDLAMLHLRALHERCPVPRVQGRLGLEEASQQRWREGYTLLMAALSSADDPWVNAQRVLLETNLQRCVEHLPRLQPQTNVPGAVLRVDGRVVGTLPLPHPWVLPTGVAEVSLSAPGHTPLRRTVSLGEGEVFREMLTLAPITAAAPAAAPAPGPAEESDDAPLPPPPRVPSSRRRPALDALTGPDDPLPSPAAPATARSATWPMWLLVGGGAAALGAAGGLWLARNAAIGSCTVESTAIVCDTEAQATEALRAADLGTAANVSLGLGLAMAAGGLTWMLLRPNNEAPRSAARPSWSVAAAPGTVALTLAGAL